MTLMTACLLLAGPVAAQSADTTAPLKRRSDTAQVDTRTVAPRTHSHRYRSRVTRPVATPEKGSLFSTGQVGNYSAVPLPEDFRYEDTRPWRQFREVPVREAESQRRVRTPGQNERRVTPLKDNVRKVRPID